MAKPEKIDGKYTIIYRDENSELLRRTPEDYGDVRDTFERIEGYTPRASPIFWYKGWVKGRSLYRVGQTSYSRNHDLLTLHHWLYNPEFKNGSYLYNFKPVVTRPLTEAKEYLDKHIRRRGYLSSSIPFTSSYCGFTPMLEDLELKKQNSRVESLANFLKQCDKKRNELDHTYYRENWTMGHYAFPIPELAEREYTWAYSQPLLSKGEHRFTKPFQPDFLYPDQIKLQGRIDLPGYGGHMPNIIGKFGKSITHHQKKGMAEFKLNYFSHFSDVNTPSQCRAIIKERNLEEEGYVLEKKPKTQGTGVDWINDCPYRLPKYVLSDKEKDIIRQQSLRPSLQSKKGCPRPGARKEAYDKVLFEKCPSQHKRNPKFKFPSYYTCYDEINY